MGHDFGWVIWINVLSPHVNHELRYVYTWSIIIHSERLYFICLDELTVVAYVYFQYMQRNFIDSTIDRQFRDTRTAC